MADAAPGVAASVARAARLAAMLEARSVAVVGASERPGSFGLRVTTEVLRSPSAPVVHLVHPRHRTVLGRSCVPTLADLPDTVDLVLLGVPDAALVEQVAAAAARGDAGAVVFGSAAGLGEQIVHAAGDLALCGAGCMGFVNMAKGVRAIGYLERDPLPRGGIALVTHSGSVFSALLRTHRRLEFSLAVSSGQELVTHTADYLGYALDMPETRVVGLFLETLRDAPRFRAGLALAAERGIAVVALTVGGSPTGRMLVAAHSGAVAGDDAAWEALFTTYGVHRARGLDEMVDTLELFSVGRRVSAPSAARGIATVHDSGAERVLVADVAQQVGTAFAVISEETKSALAGLLAPGLQPVNPLDVWSTGADTAGLLTECLTALAGDEAVVAVALAVDLVEEYDGDDAYPQAVEALLRRTDKPVVVLTNLAAAVDQRVAGRLRRQGVPVLEGTWSGLRALRHLLALPPSPIPEADVDADRQGRWLDALARGRLGGQASMALLADYGIPTVTTRSASSVTEALAAAKELGYPVVLKTDDPMIAHKAVVGGVMLDVADARALESAYRDLARRLGSRVVLQPRIRGGAELYLGLLRDPTVGPILIVGAGGAAVEASARRVGLPPLGRAGARSLLVDASEETVVALLGLSQIAVELGDNLAALDVNPLVVTNRGPVAVDALVVPGPSTGP